MPQISLRHLNYTNYFDITFCNQIATNALRKPVKSKISRILFLFPLAKFEVLDIVFHYFSTPFCIENTDILFLFHIVLIGCSTILVPKFWYYSRQKSDNFSFTVDGSSGLKLHFQLILL